MTSLLPNRTELIQTFAVTAEQMRQIEGRMFAAGFPVAALMEKVAGRITDRILKYLSDCQTDCQTNSPKIGVLVGPGHNGGDALVVARELYLRGYAVRIHCPFSKLKELTQAHLNYVTNLGIPTVQTVDELQNCEVLIDGLFGFGLEREITRDLASDIEQINRWKLAIFSIDLPSGVQTETGQGLGTAIRATHTLCLGLWKLAFLQDSALEYIGEAELIDFDIPLPDITAVLGESPKICRIIPQQALKGLPLPRKPDSHKYKNGHVLIIAGSNQYAGAAILAGLGARASGVGMLSIAVPQAIKPLLKAQLPEALVIGCKTTETGAIQTLPPEIDLNQYDAIACGPGLTQAVPGLVQQVLTSHCPVVLDADGLNILAQLDPIKTLSQRSAPSVITPHPGEFKRLFPDLGEQLSDRITATRSAAVASGSVVLLKGARVCVGNSDRVWINPESTPALARGGSGDVLTGLLGGLIAGGVLHNVSIEQMTQTAVWWHAQTGIFAAQRETELGVDAFTLTKYLTQTLNLTPNLNQKQKSPRV
ncbi:MAG: NAD(P)H-hydrate dehydratase [Microcoleaceae cyanobacterium]